MLLIEVWVTLRAIRTLRLVSLHLRQTCARRFRTTATTHRGAVQRAVCALCHGRSSRWPAPDERVFCCMAGATQWSSPGSARATATLGSRPATAAAPPARQPSSWPVFAAVPAALHVPLTRPSHADFPRWRQSARLRWLALPLPVTQHLGPLSPATLPHLVERLCILLCVQRRQLHVAVGGSAHKLALVCVAGERRRGGGGGQGGGSKRVQTGRRVGKRCLHAGFSCTGKSWEWRRGRAGQADARTQSVCRECTIHLGTWPRPSPSPSAHPP